MQKGSYPPKAPIVANPLRSLTWDQKRQMGLCFKCEEKYIVGHQCKRALMQMEGDDHEGGEDVPDAETRKQVEEEE